MPTNSPITFKPKQVTKKLLSMLPKRSQIVMFSRYGLASDATRYTLEGIGQKYGITRERVRQIENQAIVNIRKSEAYEESKPVFDELTEVIRNLGGLVSEEELLSFLARDKVTQNHIHFLLVVGDGFTKEKETEEFRHRWYIDPKLSAQIHSSLRNLYKNISDDDLLSEEDLIQRFLSHLKEVSEEYRDEEKAKRWLGVAKNLDRNPLGEWGRASSPNVRAKGIRDYSFLMLRKHGEPIHFAEVAEQISKNFDRKAHSATTHNELIKDPRFVLVGRGLYALKEWGYASGVVRDVIRDLLKKHGPMAKEDIVDRVLKERYVKENTIIVNLQNSKFFKKDKQGLYTNVR